MDQLAQKKIKVLALCDSPTSATGFAQVSKNVLNGLAATGKYDIDVIGINNRGDYYDRSQYPYAIYPAMPQGYVDMYGRGRLMNAINGKEEKFGLKGPWDIIFTIQDPFIIEGLGIDFPFAEQMRVTQELWKRTVGADNWFKWVGYFPVDSDVKENWVTRSIALCNYPIAYCDWGKGKILEHDKAVFETLFNLKGKEDGTNKVARIKTPGLEKRLSVIHHGVDTEVFKPISKEERIAFRKEFFGDNLTDDTYLVINVSRNQPRKDISRTLAAFAEFKKRVPNSHLYMHCKHEDVGGSLLEMARNFGLAPGKDFSYPRDFNAGVGYPVEMINKIYNAADLCITTTLGEGWGFITTEAMATKTPIVAPNITSILDIFGSYEFTNDADHMKMLIESETVRGVPVKAGSNSSEWICMGLEDNELIRPLTNVDDMVEKMVWVHDHPELVQKIVDRAYEWVLGQSWVHIVNRWDSIFTKAYEDLQGERKFGQMIDKAGRNDPCPCGSGQKFKKCHGSPDKVDRIRDWIEG